MAFGSPPRLSRNRGRDACDALPREPAGYAGELASDRLLGRDWREEGVVDELLDTFDGFDDEQLRFLGDYGDVVLLLRDLHELGRRSGLPLVTYIHAPDLSNRAAELEPDCYRAALVALLDDTDELLRERWPEVIAVAERVLSAPGRAIAYG